MMSAFSAASLFALAWKCSFGFVLVAASLPAPSSVFASDCHTWELDAASFWFESSAPGLPTLASKTQTLTRCFENPWTVWCTPSRPYWRACYSLRNQVQRRLRVCHNYFFSFFFLHPLRHRFAAGRAEIANVEHVEKMVPLITCEIALCQYVSKLVFGVNILIWILGSKLILSNNQSSATLWVRDTCLVAGPLPLMIILLTASLTSKMHSIAPKWEDFTFEET